MAVRVSAGRPLCLPSSSRCLFFPREGVLISGAKVLISEKSWRLSHLQGQKSVSQTFIRRHLCKESASSFPGRLWRRRPLSERQQVRRRACERTKRRLFFFCLLLCVGSRRTRRAALALRADWTQLGLKARR